MTLGKRPASIVLTVGAGAVLVVTLLIARGSADALPVELRDQLAVKVAGLLERSSPAEHHDHGHEFGDQPIRVVCAVEPFGVEPPDAATVAQVRRVYALHLCAIDDSRGSWKNSIRASGPLAVDLEVTPHVLIPRSGAGYPDRVRALVPERYQEQAFGTFADPSLIEAARRRFEGGTASRTP